MPGSVGKRLAPVIAYRGCNCLNCGAMLKELLYWAIVIALVLHLFACIFLGQSYMPEIPF